jgi:hypothetical protein
MRDGSASRWSATGRESEVERGERRKPREQDKTDQTNHQGCEYARDFGGGYLALGKRANEALVIGFAAIRMQESMQRRADGNGRYGQQEERQQTGQGRFRSAVKAF